MPEEVARITAANREDARAWLYSMSGDKELVDRVLESDRLSDEDWNELEIRIRDKNGWAHVEYDGNVGYCSAEYIAAGSSGDRFTGYGFNGSPSAELFQKLVRRCEEMWDYPISTLREMGLIDKDDMIAVYDNYEEGAERHIIGYAYAARGIDTVYDVWDLYRIYFTENYLRVHGLAKYYDKADTGRRDGFLVQHGRYYFNEIIGSRGGDLASVGSFRIESEDCWRAEGTYLYSDNTFECTIVKENGRFKIDSFSVYEELY